MPLVFMERRLYFVGKVNENLLNMKVKLYRLTTELIYANQRVSTSSRDHISLFKIAKQSNRN